MSKISYAAAGLVLAGLSWMLYRLFLQVSSLAEAQQRLQEKQQEQYRDLQMTMVDEAALKDLRETFEATEAPYSWSRGKRW